MEIPYKNKVIQYNLGSEYKKILKKQAFSFFSVFKKCNLTLNLYVHHT